MRGGEAVAEVLRREGVELVFCFPQNKMIDTAAALGIRPIVGREERSVINMADAYTRVTNGRKIGVVMTQHGPGTEAAFGGIAQAYSDSVPLLFLPSGNPRDSLGLRTTFDVVEAFRPISKWTARFETAVSVPQQLRRAFQLLRSGRPGPVVLEMPTDVFAEEFDDELFQYEPVRGHRSAGDQEDVAQAVSRLLDAERPVIRAGHGILWADATTELVEFAETVGVPVATSYAAKSVFPETHPLSIGSGGAAVSPGIAEFLPKADLVFSIGGSLLTTLGSFPLPRGVDVVQITNDADDLSLQYPIVGAVIGDAKLVLAQLTEEARRQLAVRSAASAGTDFRAEIADFDTKTAEEWKPWFEAAEQPINPLRLVAEMIEAIDPDTSIVTHDAGYPRDHLAPHYRSTTPRSYLGWGNSTPLGSSIGLAIGAKAGAPEKLSVCYLGDAGFGQSGLEIETAVRSKLPVLIVLTNNSEMSGYEEYQPIAVREFGLKTLSGSYAEIGAALGAKAYRITDPDELGPALRRAIAEVRGGDTVLLEVITSGLHHTIHNRVLDIRQTRYG